MWTEEICCDHGDCAQAKKLENNNLELIKELTLLIEELKTQISQQSTLPEQILDFAYWQKPGAKIGAKVLWSPIKSSFGRNWKLEEPEQFFIEFTRSKYIKSKTSTVCLKYLKEHIQTVKCEEISIRVGLWRGLKLGLDEDSTVQLYEDDDLLLEKLINCNSSVFVLSREELLNLPDYIDIKFPSYIEIGKTLSLFTTVGSWFDLPTKNKGRFYILSSKPNSNIPTWTLTKLETSQVKVLYHKTLFSYESSRIKRDTFRIYEYPNVQVYKDKVEGHGDYAKITLGFNTLKVNRDFLSNRFYYSRIRCGSGKRHNSHNFKWLWRVNVVKDMFEETFDMRDAEQFDIKVATFTFNEDSDIFDNLSTTWVKIAIPVEYKSIKSRIVTNMKESRYRRKNKIFMKSYLPVFKLNFLRVKTEVSATGKGGKLTRDAYRLYPILNFQEYILPKICF